MNSDPYDSAAWRSLGMLNADESASYDEARRHDPLLENASQEMDRISTAIALATSTPIAPQPEQLHLLQMRLGLQRSRRAPIWLALSGWAAAAMLTLLLVICYGENRELMSSLETSPRPPDESVPVKPNIPPHARHADPPTPTSPSMAEDPKRDPSTADAENLQQIVHQETRRLAQENDELRDQIATMQEQERERFEAVPGIAMPVIMKMSPPGSELETAPSLAANDTGSPVYQLLADTLRSTNPNHSSLSNAGDLKSLAEGADEKQSADLTASSSTLAEPDALAEPSAIPIYDHARRVGILKVDNLLPAPEGMTHHLWVIADENRPPIHVGSLPNAGSVTSETFDFNLSPTMELPKNFILSLGTLTDPTAPNAENTVLQGPPPPTR